jgi:hypothetical protein
VRETLGCLVKDRRDIDELSDAELSALVAQTAEAAAG